MAKEAKTKSRSVEAGTFKKAIDKQNKLESARGGAAKRKRDAAEGEAAQAGLPTLERQSKGRPKQGSMKQKATSKKSPQATRSQSR
jgi:hypothetical protein